MALKILKGGHWLTVYDRSPEVVARLTAAGATAASSAREVGETSEAVVMMLPEPSHVQQGVLGPDAIAAGLHRSGVFIDMGTIDPQTSQRVGAALRKRGFDMVDSPVGKTSGHAATGTLTLMVGGDPEVIKRVKPVLDCKGSDTFCCGGPGMGHVMKIINNLLATTIMAANTEVLAIGIKCGLTLELMLEVMSTTMARNDQLFVAMPKKAFKGDDSPGFIVKLGSKEVRLAVELAKAQGFDALVGRAAHETLERAAKRGCAERDTAALMKIREDALGIKVRPAAAKQAS